MCRIFEFQSRPAASETLGAGPSILCFNKPSMIVMWNFRGPFSLTIYLLIKLIKWLVWCQHPLNNHDLHTIGAYSQSYFCHNRFQHVSYMTRVVFCFSFCILSFTGVGKSSLVHLLCQNQVLGNPSWTVGCSVDVRVCFLYFSFLVVIVKITRSNCINQITVLWSRLN